jgi:hypothetical protein
VATRAEEARGAAPSAAPAVRILRQKRAKRAGGGLINNNNNSLFFQRTLTSLTSFETKALLFIGMEGQLITV